jgi:hypothetical protein
MEAGFIRIGSGGGVNELDLELGTGLCFREWYHKQEIPVYFGPGGLLGQARLRDFFCAVPILPSNMKSTTHLFVSNMKCYEP